MVKVGVLGNGKLGKIIIDALNKGLAPECEFIGAASRSLGITVFDLIEDGADIIIEAATPDALKSCIVDILKKGVSVIPLSTGIFADPDCLEAVYRAAKESGAKVYLPHGAEGAFDLASTFSLVPGMKATVIQNIPDHSGIKTGTFIDDMPREFKGSVLEGFALSPAHLNVAIETAIACGGFDNTSFEIRVPEDGRMGFSLELENDKAEAVLNIKNKIIPGTPPDRSMIALSAVSMLNRITSPITF